MKRKNIQGRLIQERLERRKMQERLERLKPRPRSRRERDYNKRLKELFKKRK